MRSASSEFSRAISVWGLLILLILLILVFSVLRPDTFLTYFNIRSILSNKSVQALVALSVLIPMTSNQFDLSAGFNVGISQVLAIGLQGQGLPWWGAVGAVLAMGALVGLINGILVTRVKIDSFIATLGTGTILYGLNAWYTGASRSWRACHRNSLRCPAISASFLRRRSMRCRRASRSGSSSNICRSAASSTSWGQAPGRRN